MEKSYFSKIKERLERDMSEDYVPNISVSDLQTDIPLNLRKLPTDEDPDTRKFIIGRKLEKIQRAKQEAHREMPNPEAERIFGQTEYPVEQSSEKLEERIKKSFYGAQQGHPSDEWIKKFRNPQKTNAVMPKDMLTITNPSFQNALTYNYKPIRKEATLNAYLAAVTPMFGEDIYLEDVPTLDLTVRDNMLYLGDNKAVEVHYNDTRGRSMTDESHPVHFEECDNHFLNNIYTILFVNLGKDLPTATDHEEIINYSAEIYIPDLMEYLGYGRDYSERDFAMVVRQLRNFRNITGVIVTNQNTDKPSKDYFELIELESIKTEKNTIRLRSPYMNELVCVLRKDEIKRNLLTEKERKMRMITCNKMPNHSSLIKPSIVKARNKRATEIVDVIVKLIEQTGPDGTPHISAETIISRCPYLEISLRCCKLDRDRNRLLKKTFTAAWEYLNDYTLLKETYKDIKFPTEVPVMKHLEDTIYNFPHNGRL